MISQKYSKIHVFLILLPVLLLSSTYFVFINFVHLWGLKEGYLFSMAFYWVFWCLLIPYILIGRNGLKELFTSGCSNFRKLRWLDMLLLIIPPLMAVLFGPFLNRISRVTMIIGILSFVLAVINAISEEILWRGVYVKLFPKKYFFGYIYPTIGFMIWHLAPNAVNPSSQGVIPFVAGAGFIALCWGLVALRTNSIRWTIISHIILDLSGMGALFYLI